MSALTVEEAASFLVASEAIAACASAARFVAQPETFPVFMEFCRSRLGSESFAIIADSTPAEFRRHIHVAESLAEEMERKAQP